MEDDFTVGKQFWPLDQNLGEIWLLESHPYRWIKPRFNLGCWINGYCRQMWWDGFGPSNQHGRDLGRQITLERGTQILLKNRRFIVEKSSKYRRFSSLWANFSIKSTIFYPFLAIFLLFNFSPQNIVLTSSDISQHFLLWVLHLTHEEHFFVMELEIKVVEVAI